MIFINKVLKITSFVTVLVFSMYMYYRKEIIIRSYKSIGLLLFILIFISNLLYAYFSNHFDFKFISMNLSILLSSIVYFGLGLFFNIKLSHIQRNILFGVLAFILVFDAQFFNRSGLDLSLIEDNNLVGNYLMWGDTFSILSIVLISNLKGKLRYIAIFICFLGVAFMLSRASLISFSLAILLVEAMKNNLKNNFIAVSALVVVIGGFIGFSDQFGINLRSFRIDLSKSTSLTIRLGILKDGLLSIQQNIFLGEFLGQLNNSSEYRGFGNYIHNYLSLWRQFGLFAFLIYIYYVFTACKNLIIKNEGNQYLGLITFLILESLFFRGYSFPHFWILAGIISNPYFYNDKSHKLILR